MRGEIATSPTRWITVLSAVGLWSRIQVGSAFISSSPTKSFDISQSFLLAKRNKNRRDGDDLNSWYDDVDDDATPEGVFWEEMERQRLFNQLGGERTSPTTSGRQIASMSSSSSSSSTSSSFSPMPNLSFGLNGGGASDGGMMTGQGPTMMTRKPPTMEQQKAAEATLSEYTLFQVKDNWLNEDLRSYFQNAESITDEEELSLEEETRRLEEQLEALPDGYGATRKLAGFGDSDFEEPWEHWGDDDSETDVERANVLKVPEPTPGTLDAQQRLID